jgi:hypothetical protein
MSWSTGFTSRTDGYNVFVVGQAKKRSQLHRKSQRTSSTLRFHLSKSVPLVFSNCPSPQMSLGASKYGLNGFTPTNREVDTPHSAVTSWPCWAYEDPTQGFSHCLPAVCETLSKPSHNARMLASTHFLAAKKMCE